MAKPKATPSPTAAIYPHASVAFYGPDDSVATLAVVGILRKPGQAPDPVARWQSTGLDVREDPEITAQIVAWIRAHGVGHTSIAEEIMGCPHEPGVEFPLGETCPLCSFWRTRRRMPKV